MKTNIFISAGDISGDLHAANLMRAMKSISKDVCITSIGGRELKEVSDVFIEDIASLNAFGFFPVKQLAKLKQVFKRTVQCWKENKPDKVILVDYYGFNIHLAQAAFKQNIPVYYYISPQVWASRPGRIKKLAKFVKKMFVILPFEEKLYKDAGVDAVFVGHPLIDIVPIAHHSAKFKETQKPIIGFFPGSRQHIVERHMRILEKVKDIIKGTLDAEFKIFGVKGIDYNNTDMPIIYEDTYDERKKLALAVTVSGTVSLESALLGVPMVVFYKLSKFNYMIAKMVANIKYITMVNILEKEEVVPELIQEKATPENIAKTAIDLLKNKEKLEYLRKKLASFRSQLGQPFVALRTAKLILND